MIERLFTRFFGPKTEPQTLSPKESLSSQAEVPESRLPEDQGFTFTRDMGRRHNPRVQLLKADSLEELWSGNALGEKPYKAFREIKADLRKEEKYQTKIDEHIALDQSDRDFDRREEHVVIPSSKFEYHGDRDDIKFIGTGGEAKKDGSIYSLETQAGIIHLNGQNGDFNFQPHQASEIRGTDYSSHTKVLQSGEFGISAEGLVTLPSASNLDQAANIEEDRSLALEVQEKIRWAQEVADEAAYRVDRFENDHDPRRGHSLASGLDEYWFIRNTSLPYMNHQTYSIESGPSGTRLYEDSYGKTPELLLTVQKDGQVTKLESGNSASRSLHITWDKEKGTVQAERRATQGWEPEKPKEEPPKATSNSWSSRGSDNSSYSPRPRARQDRDALPRDFSASGRIRSHGGGHHKMVKASGRFPQDQTYPEKFTDKETGKTYYKAGYRTLDGSEMYIER